MLQITETDNRRIKVISFGTKGKIKTAQVVVIHQGNKEKKERNHSATFHLHFVGGTWVYRERIRRANGIVEQITEFICDKLPRASRHVREAMAA